MATKPQKYADGGAMQAGLQPTMAIGYADGGQTGPSTPGLDSNTTTFNQDYLRGPSFGSPSTANAVSPTASVSAPSAISSSSSPTAGGTSTGQTGSFSDLANSGLAKLAASVAIPGFAKAMPVISAAQGAYNLFNGLTSKDQTNADAAPQGMNSNAYGIGRATALGQLGDFASSKLSGDQMGTFISQLDTNRPAICEPDSVAPTSVAPTGDTSAAGNYSGTGISDSQAAGRQNTSGAGETGGVATGGNNGDNSGGGARGTAGGFADGGQLGAQAMNPTQPPAPAGPPGLQLPGAAQPAPTAPPPMHPALANLHVQNKMANPQVMQAMKAHISQAIQAGKVNPQQLQLMGQLAQSAMQHPELWQKLREFAMQAGIPDAQHLPMQFNQGMCMAMLAAAQAAQHGDQPGAFANGGMLHGQGTGTSDSIAAHNTSTGQPVKLSNGEYIIPADVVATKGKEFFDNIVRKYHTPAAMQH